MHAQAAHLTLCSFLTSTQFLSYLLLLKKLFKPHVFSPGQCSVLVSVIFSATQSKLLSLLMFIIKIYICNSHTFYYLHLKLTHMQRSEQIEACKQKDVKPHKFRRTQEKKQLCKTMKEWLGTKYRFLRIFMCKKKGSIK